ncbi:dicarboxylate/amino acid:cation symporter [Corynebacterium sp. ES2794-CONJ1]|nr:dicarboxylate/amino acid:cation symporter [Corynebacterium sp. ES2775-CONJ]MCS4492216.1 dicarboxylate/amino acid:cation symporter [Corynebacterium sp. ES2715-CONJ3]MCU9519735.1 dicarboxylate/amino acid:cation symporter [Corynebacterium sp. ES2794-CONJ1]
MTIMRSFPMKLLIGLILGLIVGSLANEPVIAVIDALRSVLGDLILYAVPFIILGFITPAIIRLKAHAGKILGITLTICYLSSVGASMFSIAAGHVLIPYLDIGSKAPESTALPEKLFALSIAPVMPVMTALVTAVLMGLAILWTQSKRFGELFEEFNKIVLAIVNQVVIRFLPFYIGATFATLAYEGAIIHELPVFIKVLAIVIVGHYLWLALLYALGGLFSGTNPWEVLRHYGPAYMTAVGTMSSAATLSVALKSASKSKTLDPEVRNFCIPLCANTHLCGSVLTETFFVMVVSQILYGSLPSVSNLVLFGFLLGIFAIAAPGVPGGTVVASIGLITAILGFDETGVALMLSIFALQDSFGTACNVTGDGAISLMVTGIKKRLGLKEPQKVMAETTA